MSDGEIAGEGSVASHKGHSRAMFTARTLAHVEDAGDLLTDLLRDSIRQLPGQIETFRRSLQQVTNNLESGEIRMMCCAAGSREQPQRKHGAHLFATRRFC